MPDHCKPIIAVWYENGRAFGERQSAERPGWDPARESVAEECSPGASGSLPTTPGGPPGATAANRLAADTSGRRGAALRFLAVASARPCGAVANILFAPHRESPSSGTAL